eukprot:2731833-Ditylum_brightwellii.AAC.1
MYTFWPSATWVLIPGVSKLPQYWFVPVPAMPYRVGLKGDGDGIVLLQTRLLPVCACLWVSDSSG